VRLERREAELSDFVRAVRRVKEVLAPLRDKRIRLSITGGMRALNLVVFTAYLLIDWAHEPRIDVYLEGRGTALTLPSLHRILTLNLTETQRLILSAMREGVTYTSSDISAYVRKDRSTVYKNLLALQRLGLVAREGNRYRVTELGAMILNSKPPPAVD
jgi:CRISPR locus-related DNA-binding protein